MRVLEKLVTFLFANSNMLFLTDKQNVNLRKLIVDKCISIGMFVSIFIMFHIKILLFSLRVREVRA